MDYFREINLYFTEYLSPLLSSLDVSTQFLKEVIDNVRMQVYSFCSHWNDVEFRNGLMVIGLEEGIFYEPKNSVNPFIVLAIRNSLIETIQSEDYTGTGLTYNPEENSIKAITTQAIEYFSNIKMDEICNHIFIDPSADLYGIVTRKYPIAWEALKKIGNTTSQAISYKKIGHLHDPNLFSCFMPDPKVNYSTFKVSILDGYSTEIDENLKIALHAVVSENNFFFTESFKTITRNFEKLLHIMEYLLVNDKPFVTCNYYITNGYVTKRSSLLKPAHTYTESLKNFENLTGIRKTHREAIQEVLKGIIGK